MTAPPQISRPTGRGYKKALGCGAATPDAAKGFEQRDKSMSDVKVAPAHDTSNYTADTHFPADASQDFDAWHFEGPAVQLDSALRPDRMHYEADPLEVAVVRIVNEDGTHEADLHLGQKLLDPGQWLTPSSSAAFAVHKAGIAGVPLPVEPSGFDAHTIDQCTVASLSGRREVVVQTLRSDEEDGTYREVEMLVAERDETGRHAYSFCEGVTLSLGQAREVAAGLLLAIAAHEVDQQRRGDDR